MVEIHFSLWPNFLNVQDYPTDEILVVYDYDFKYGQNFYCAITEEAKEKILNVSLSTETSTLSVKSILWKFFHVDIIWFTVLCNIGGKVFHKNIKWRSLDEYYVK